MAHIKMLAHKTPLLRSCGHGQPVARATLRKERDWSQPELGKMIGTSGAIIGRYERAKMTLSIEVARKLADVFEVTVDYLISDNDIPETLKNRQMLVRWQARKNSPTKTGTGLSTLSMD